MATQEQLALLKASLVSVQGMTDKVSLPSFLPGLDPMEPTIAVPFDINYGKSWRFGLYWKGILVSEVTAQAGADGGVKWDQM